MVSTFGRRLGAALLNVTVSRRGYRTVRDLVYGSHPRQRFYLYLPPNAATPAPVLLFFYGGSWHEGEKSWYRAVGEAFASRNIAVAVADYRVYPEAVFPAFLEDGALAVRALRGLAKAHGIDPARLFLGGHSAGAYIAMMLILDERYLRAVGGGRSWVRGAAGISGPYDFLPLKDPMLIEIFGGAQRKETQPIHYAATGCPPVLLATGARDKTVSARNTRRMAEKLRAGGIEVIEKIYPNAGHIGILLSLARPLRWRTSLREDIARFITDK
jgi:acetyl esterase/lipase